MEEDEPTFDDPLKEEIWNAYGKYCKDVKEWAMEVIKKAPQRENEMKAPMQNSEYTVHCKDDTWIGKLECP